ncbi:hypothetical protein EDB19DRAFT_1825912 [Suillus lakei]|nr:hypothetical protein EDB19DRAFT_1825912 [Suillus lakei]
MLLVRLNMQTIHRWASPLYRIASLAFTSTGQPPAGEIYPTHGDDLLEDAGIDPMLFQPSLLQHRHSRQHAGQPHASGSAPQPSHLLPPTNISINHDYNNADSQHWYYDPLTNPYTGMPVMLMPSLWHIPSQPQVQIPPQLVGYGQLPANHQFYGNFSSWPVGIQTLSDDVPPLPPFPLSHDELALNIPYPSSNPMHDLFNLEAPVYICPPDMNDPVPQTRDDIMNIELTPVTPSHIVSVSPRYPPPYLNAFISEFTHPVLSKGRDVLLPQGVEDEVRQEPIMGTAKPKEDSIFSFMGGRMTDKEGRGRVHSLIVKSAKKEITRHALNLKQAATKHMHAWGTEWVSYNLGILYMTLSEPCKNIMQSCRKHTCNLVLDGFGLRLSIWSENSEPEHQQTIIAHLLDDQIFPPNFVMGLGTDDQWYFLENQVVLNVILDTVWELKLVQYLEDLDSLSCVAAVTVHCALEKVRDRTSPNVSDIKFSGTAFKDLYAKLVNYIKEVIMKCPILWKRWEDYKKLIKARLTQ